MSICNDIGFNTIKCCESCHEDKLLLDIEMCTIDKDGIELEVCCTAAAWFLNSLEKEINV